MWQPPAPVQQSAFQSGLPRGQWAANMPQQRAPGFGATGGQGQVAQQISGEMAMFGRPGPPPQRGGGPLPRGGQANQGAVDAMQHWFYVGVALYTLLLLVTGYFVARQAFDPFEQAKFEIHHWQGQMFEWKEKVDAWKGAYNEHADLLPEPALCPVCPSCEAPDLCTGNECPDDELPKCANSAVNKAGVKLASKVGGLRLMDMLRFKLGPKPMLPEETDENGCPPCPGGCPRAAEGSETCDKTALFKILDALMNKVLKFPVDHVLALEYATAQQCLRIAMKASYEHYEESMLVRPQCLTLQCMIDTNIIPSVASLAVHKTENATTAELNTMRAVGFTA